MGLILKVLQPHVVKSFRLMLKAAQLAPDVERELQRRLAILRAPRTGETAT